MNGPVQRIELNYANQEIGPGSGLEFVLHAYPDLNVTIPGSVRSYSIGSEAAGVPAVWPRAKDLKAEIGDTLRPGVRACIGNMGCELTFRHVTGRLRTNVGHLLLWADEAYAMVGDRLILAPMDFDILQDATVGGPLMHWAAERRVPLVVFCGFRLLFPQDAFPLQRALCEHHPLDVPWTSLRYPYRDLSDLIRQTGVEMWTGAGTHEGLLAGVLDRAATFGMRGVIAERRAWERAFGG